MSRFESPLNNIKIASPCSADWESMFGNERKRFCGDCKLNVYNISGVSRNDAEDLLLRSEGRLCVRYYRRADGTILTNDCPVGWAKVKQRASMIATAGFSIFVSMVGSLSLMSLFSKKTDLGIRFPIPFATPTPKHKPLMGVMVRPSPTPTPKASPEPKKGEALMGEVSIERKVKIAPGEAS